MEIIIDKTNKKENEVKRLQKVNRKILNLVDHLVDKRLEIQKQNRSYKLEILNLKKKIKCLTDKLA